jgi:hypothetical protein
MNNLFAGNEVDYGMEIYFARAYFGAGLRL